MKPLDRVRKTIQAEITVRQIIKELLVEVEDGIENKVKQELFRLLWRWCLNTQLRILTTFQAIY